MTNRTGLKLEEDVATTSQVLNAAEGILSEAFGGQVKLAIRKRTRRRRKVVTTFRLS